MEILDSAIDLTRIHKQILSRIHNESCKESVKDNTVYMFRPPTDENPTYVHVKM